MTIIYKNARTNKLKPQLRLFQPLSHSPTHLCQTAEISDDLKQAIYSIVGQDHCGVY